MRKMKRTISATMAGMMLFAGAAFADEKADRIAEIKEQIAQLESELAELESEEPDEAEFSVELDGVTYTYKKNVIYEGNDQDFVLIYFTMQNESGQVVNPGQGVNFTAFQDGVSLLPYSIADPNVECQGNTTRQVQSGYSLDFFKAFAIESDSDITLVVPDIYGNPVAEYTFSINK
jgi:hypothetical protein